MRDSTATFCIAGMGASAGGLEALCDFFEAMPVKSNIGFVVIQHLHPTQKSLTAEIIGKHTNIPAIAAEEGMRVEPDTIYTIPPNIHMNEYRVRSESGPQVFYRAGSGAGRLLAGTMQEALITALSPQKERAAMPGDYFILQLDTPSVLVECGFISNPAEEALLLSPAYQEKLGEAIADGAAEYFRLAQAEK